MPAPTAVEAERDYYRSLLELASYEEPLEMLGAALRLLTGLTCAREGYIELYEDEPREGAGAHAFIGDDAERAAAIREVVSRGIIARAIATGETVLTASALSDPRFEELDSVRDHAIERVVCAPIGRELPLGVVYLGGTRASSGAPLGPKELVRHVELFARCLVPLVERLRAAMRERSDAGEPGSGAFAEIIGRSPALRDIVRRARFAAPLDITVLLTGPTGGGKTLFAQAIHRASARAGAPLLEVNCAALPAELIENELFGAVEGAHSNVPRGGLRGKVDAASGGTLFLDEVAELPLRAQAKLLQLLQSRTYFPLGAHEPRQADVRVIAATNVDLEAAMREKRFREDLYYRLNVLELRVPGLAERPEDVAPLAAHFARHACERHDLAPTPLSPGASRAVALAVWPGNVRELAHRVESAVVNARLRGAPRVEVCDLFGEQGDAVDAHTLQEATRRFQQKHLLATLDATNWNISETARRLDVVRSHVYNLIKLHGLSRVAE